MNRLLLTLALYSVDDEACFSPVDLAKLMKVLGGRGILLIFPNTPWRNV